MLTGLHVPEVLPAGVSAFDTADARGMRGFSCAVGSRVLALPIFRHLGAIGTDVRASKQQEEQQCMGHGRRLSWMGQRCTQATTRAG